MKINPEKIILESKDFHFKKKIFLISGNEETLIKKIQHILIQKIRNEGFGEIQKNVSKKISFDNNNLNDSLFFKSKIILYENPKEVDQKYFDTINYTNTAIIICHTNLTNSSRIKKYFDTHKEFFSISCYKLSRNIKKIFLDFFLNQHNIQLENDCYWFFLDNTSNRYQLFENEITKLINYDKKKIIIGDLRLLLSNSDSEEIDNLFFLMLEKNTEIIKQAHRTINSSLDSYLVLQRIKFFLGLLYSAKNIDGAIETFPKYLFKYKTKFLSIFEKTNTKKIAGALALIKKTELLLRKHSSMHQAISERFLLNLKKSLG